MGNSGRSSTGCGMCRKRKIKCDEGRPGCRKCAQIRKTCPGYPFSIELQLRSDAAAPDIESGAPRTYLTPIPFTESSQPSRSSSVVPNVADRSITPIYLDQPVPRQSQLPQDVQLLAVKDEYSKQDETLAEISRRRSKSISPPLKYDVQHQATCFFLNLFSYQASRLYGIPILDFLPDMLSKSGTHSAIQHASTAVSRMTLADRYSGLDARLQTTDEYARALKSVSDTMYDPEAAVQDEAVTAVWLLGLYEAVSSVLSHGRKARRKHDTDEEWRAHIAHMRGAMRLLRLRGQKQFQNPRSEKIFRIFKAAIQMRLFILNSITSTDFKFFEVDVYRDEHEFLPSETANKASEYFIQIARHLEATKYALHKYKLQPESRDLATEIDQLLYDGECYDASMIRWSKQEPGWDMMDVQGNMKGTVWALYPFHALYFFYSFWVFLYWLRYLIGRVKLYETLIEIVKMKKVVAVRNGINSSKLKHLDSKLENFTSIIQRTADDLIGLTAYALGDVSNTGQFLSVPSVLNPGGGWNEVNVVAAMQLVIPFKALLRSPYALPAQKNAIDLAIKHIADGFRRQPIIPEFVP